MELENPSVFEIYILGIQDYSAEHNKSTDPVEEDAIATRLRRLGGTFYKYIYGMKDYENRDAKIHTWFGWPEDDEHEGGVWVLKLTKDDTFERNTGRIRLATSMQDRCWAIEMCGGVFCASPTEEHLVSIEAVPHQCGMTAQEREERQRQALLFEP